ncbi:T9SS type B sorting domain-containing protein [Galbibacter sp. BG1]|uniref:T9SS type B sorting domain-containing protein n=1 Tax=Galbibacter sp. BG1 TaxID=1170699 RepID=UPI0015BADF96|nr:T9SS type B sorting domain-containing protein [Galbibacter sp. BG1]QLE01143.1 T9SS type B sorting domain-containing protein [Galbibacter sp. BG1]
MKKNYFTLKSYLLFACIFFAGISALSAQVAVPFSPRLPGDNIRIKGDIVLVGNNILNRASQSNPEDANTPYNGSANNNDLWMEYIDIDGDPTTFSSSEAALNLPNSCAKVAYAGLYWAATYPNERSTDRNRPFNGTPRFEDWNQVKFRMPGGNYIDIAADNDPDPVGEEDAIIFDGFDPVNINNSFKDSPIICYRDVTSLLQTLTTPNGTYTTANIRATKGRRTGSSSAGWLLVVIYEDPTETGKFISTFDGYAGVQGSNTADIKVNGFRTLPPPFPVRAKLGVSALEGDRSITGDQLLFKADGVATPINVQNTLNPATNFFNATITNLNAQVPTRNPYGTNTLGMDIDLLNLNNPANTVLPNDETGATLTLTTNGDGYGSFFASFSVEIIEPKIQLAKTVEDLTNTNIQGEGVELGQEMYYTISFDNIGNDDADNFTIRDVLPINVDLIESELILPPAINGKEITYTYDYDTNVILFTVPNEYVEIADPSYTIRMRVKVKENCFELRDACSNLIQNTAYATYRGVLNDNEISDDPSVAGFDNCNFGIPGSTNFLVDLGDCDFSRQVQICGTSVQLSAGVGFDTYQWQRRNPDGTFSDIPGATSQTYNATTIGTYRVTKTIPTPCASFDEDITVIPFNNNATSPFIAMADEVVTCTNDGIELPKFYLCGTNDDRSLDVNFSDAISFTWERLEGGCADEAIDDCPTRSNNCTWEMLSTEEDYVLTGPGEYRFTAEYQNGCFNRFYFKAYENSVDPEITTKDIICNTPGEILITGIGNGYEYAISNDPENFNSSSALWQPESNFTVADEGVYSVFIRQTGIDPDATDREPCLFRFDEVNIVERDFKVDIDRVNPLCYDLKGSVSISINNVEPNYIYTIRNTSGEVVQQTASISDNNHVFNNLNAGVYEVTVTSDDGCSFTDDIELVRPEVLGLTANTIANIGCADGQIELTPTGGTADYNYAIWRGPGISYSDLEDIPATAFTTNAIFEIPAGQEGQYEFVVVDAGNCVAYSNRVEVKVEPAPIFNITKTNETCFEEKNGTISVNVTNNNGYNMTFSRDSINFNANPKFFNLEPGDYEIVVRATKGVSSCDFVQNIEILPATQISSSATRTKNYTCLEDGEITFTAGTGGSGNFEYSIDGATWQSGLVFGSLEDGTYTPRYRDLSNPTCVRDLPNIVIDPLPAKPTLTRTVDYNCDGTADITVFPNDTSYQYRLENASGSVIRAYQTSNVFQNIAVGNYIIRVNYGSDCTVTRGVSVQTGNTFSATRTNLTNPQCFGGTGSITFQVQNFNTTTGYNYTVDGGAPQTSTSATETVTSLTAGAHTIIITDPNNASCTANITGTIAVPSQVSVTGSITSDLTCNNTGATIRATASGGTPGYTYQLEDNASPTPTVVRPFPNPTGRNFNNVPAGTYYIRVRDANGCEARSTNPIVVEDPIAIEFESIPTACYVGGSNGSITININPNGNGSVGNGNLQVRINGGPFVNLNNPPFQHVFNNLSSGDYDIRIKDGFGCFAEELDVTIQPKLISTAVLDNDFLCGTDAQVTINTTGGNGSFTYAWANTETGPFTNTTGFSGNVFNTNIAGTYYFEVTDAENCTDIAGPIEITPATPPSFTVTPTDITCNGDSTGVLDVDIDTNVGVGPYTIAVLNTDTSTSYGRQTTNLPAGNYEITVTDSKNCTNTETATIIEPSPIMGNLSKTDISCSGDPTIGSILGTITIDASGGTSPYEYFIRRSDYSYTDSYDTAAPNSNDHTFDDLDFGEYVIRIVDANGCEIIENITIATAPSVILTTSGAAGCTLGSGTMMVDADTADPMTPLTSGDFYFSIYPALNDFDPAPLASNPGWFQADTDTGKGFNTAYEFTGLNPGVTYQFIVYDRNTNCSFVQTTTTPVETTSTMEATLDPSSSVTCNGFDNGSITFTLNDPGDIANSIPPAGATSADYEVYTANGDTGTGITGNALVNTATTASGLSPGEYYILFTEVGGTNNGCVFASDTFIIDEAPALLEINATADNANCVSNSGTVTAIARYGVAPYEFVLQPQGDPAPTVASWTSTNTNGVFSADAGNYTVYVKDANDCIQPFDITINPDPEPEISRAINDDCVAEGNYAVTVTLDNPGVPPYRLIVNGAVRNNVIFNGSNQYEITGLNSGTTTIEILDSNGCGEVETFEIHPPLQFNAQVVSDIDCVPNNAEVEIEVFGGSSATLSNITFDVTGPAGFSGITGQTLSTNPETFAFASVPGDYTITVNDSGTGCSIVKTINVPPAVEPNFTATPTDVSCNGGMDGFIELNVVDNGISPINFTISPVAGTFDAASNSFVDLPAGTYTITGTGNNSCSTPVSGIVVGEPTSVTADPAAVTQFACVSGNSINNAVITITGATGGTTISGNYTYEFVYDNNTPGDNTDDRTQRSSSNEFIVSEQIGGEVAIQIIDDNGCSTVQSVTIAPYSNLDAIGLTPFDPTCNPGMDGSVEINAVLTPAPGTADITYDISNFDGSFTASFTGNSLTHTFTGLDIDNYIVRVTNNDTGCFLEDTFELEDPNTFEIDVNKLSDAICFGDNGQVTFTITDPVNGYSGGFDWEIFSVEGTPNDTSDDISVATGNQADLGPTAAINVPQGSYYVEIIQSAAPSCTNTERFVILGPNSALMLDVAINENLDCTIMQGEIEANATGGWGDYEYAIVAQGATPTTADYGSNNIFGGLVAGNYDIYTRDSGGCEEMQTISLIQPNPIIANAIKTDVTGCEGDTNGTVTATITPPFGGQPAINNTLPYYFSLNVYNSDGTAIVSRGALQTSGAGAFNFTYSGLGAGFYSVTVTDNFGCETETNQVEILEPNEVSAALTLNTTNTCDTGAVLTLTAEGGTGAGTYSYSENPTGPWTSFTGNSVNIPIPGPITNPVTSQFYVQDGNLCVSGVSNGVTVDPIPAIIITPEIAADVTCNGEANGVIRVRASGGLGNYMYTLYDVSGNVVVRPQQASNTFNNLPAGVYFVQVDSQDCDARLRIEILEGMPLQDKTPIVYNPQCSDDLGTIEVGLEGGTGIYQYAISPSLDKFQDENMFYDLEPGSYTVIAQDSKGCNPYIYKLDVVAPSPLAAKADIMEQEYCIGDATGSFEVNIAGGTAPYSTALNTQDDSAFVQDKTVYDNLEGGETYVVFIKDANGCTSNVIVTLDDPVDLSPRAEINFMCIDNSAANEVEIILAQQGLEDVIYTMDGGADQFDNRFSNVAPGDHTVTVSYFGCERTVDFTIDTIQPLNLAVGQSNINEFTMEPSGGFAPYEYFVNGESRGNNPKYIIRQSGIYEVKVIDANGCEVIAQIEMEFIDINIPNVFTPDGDNNNDTWTPKNTLQFPNILTRVYDRYGRQVAELRIGEEWDGRYNGTELPTGDYWYVVKLNGELDDREFVGHFTLYR